jgi:hypothetical protein
MKSLRSNDVRVGETIRCRLRDHEWQGRDLLRSKDSEEREEVYMLDNRIIIVNTYIAPSSTLSCIRGSWMIKGGFEKPEINGLSCVSCRYRLIWTALLVVHG